MRKDKIVLLKPFKRPKSKLIARLKKMTDRIRNRKKKGSVVSKKQDEQNLFI